MARFSFKFSAVCIDLKGVFIVKDVSQILKLSDWADLLLF